MCGHISCWVSNTRTQVFHHVRQRQGQCQIAWLHRVDEDVSYICCARYVHVCETEDSDTTPVEQISWCQVLRLPNRPFGLTKQTFWTEDQFVGTSSPGIRDHETKVAEIVMRDIQRTNLTSGDVSRLVSLGQRRRSHTCVLDTIGS